MDVWAVRMGEYKALPACVYHFIRKKYPTADNEGLYPS